MLGAILTIAALVAIGAFGYLLCWKADDRAELEQKEYMDRKEKHK